MSWLALKILAWLGVAAGLTFVIFVHELGHFLVAKACGVKCEKFYVGFDFFEFKIPFTNWKIPRSLVKFQWGETEYGLGSLPLGGYVKMLGQDDDPRNAEHEAERIRKAAPNASDERVQAIATGTSAEGLVNGQSVERLSNEALAHAHPGQPQKPEEAPVPAKTTEGKTILLDPRSYPAKPVPARMAIISAGVIMNLIFAVILAAVAYRLGVEEMPAIVGSTSPGGAAWQEGIEPGSKIIQIGRNSEPYEKLRWSDIKITAILNSGREVPLLVRKPNGEEQWYEVRPTKIPGSNTPIIGVGIPRKPVIETFPEEFDHLNARSSVPLKDFDRIIEAGGQKIISGADLMAVFAQQPHGALPIKVERKPQSSPSQSSEKDASPPEVIETVLEPKPMRDFGLIMKIGPIIAIRANSPAARADLQINDEIVEVNGESVGDPLSLSQRLTPQPGASGAATLVIERKDRQGQPVRRTISVPLEPPLQSPTQTFINEASIESIGVAFDVTSEVADVIEGSPAEQAGFQPGDKVTRAQFVWDDEKQGQKLSVAAHYLLLEEFEIAPGKSSWAHVIFGLQLVDADAKAKLTWRRGNQVMSAVLRAHDSTSFVNDMRGMSLYVDSRENIADNWSEALYLGFRESRDQLTQVLTILHRLVTGRISITNLSGPPGIIAMAGKFASEGATALLLFLTMLSANLAVLNFLPIPALDGGHMLFLSAEAVRGKPVDERLQIRLTIAGVICLLSLMVFATAMDIQRFFG